MTGGEKSIALVGGPTEYQPSRGHDERFKRADVSKARALLGWEPVASEQD